MKYTRGCVHGILSHNERNKGENGEYKNKDIDKSKTHLNYSFIHDEKSAEERLKSRLNEIDVSKRSDVNVLASWVVTLPKEVKEKDQKKFFKCVNEFLTHKYGNENIISSDVHYDETTPHLHFCFVPVVENKKKNATKKYKVSAKELLTQTHLQRFHGELERSLIVHLGYECGILNGATKQNKSIKELKQEEINKLTQIIEKEPEIKKGFFSQKETVKIPIDEYETLKKKTQEYLDLLSGKKIKEVLEENAKLKEFLANKDARIDDLREQNRKIQEQAQIAIDKAKAEVASEIAEKDAKIKELDQCSTKLADLLKTQKSQNESLKARNKALTQSRGGRGG